MQVVLALWLEYHLGLTFIYMEIGLIFMYVKFVLLKFSEAVYYSYKPLL